MLQRYKIRKLEFERRFKFTKSDFCYRKKYFFTLKPFFPQMLIINNFIKSLILYYTIYIFKFYNSILHLIHNGILKAMFVVSLKSNLRISASKNREGNCQN